VLEESGGGVKPSAVALELLTEVDRAWGRAWALTLAKAMRDGFVVSVDGEPCLVAPARAVKPAPVYRQECMI
jgi:hypothetical protein